MARTTVLLVSLTLDVVVGLTWIHAPRTASRVAQPRLVVSDAERTGPAICDAHFCVIGPVHTTGATAWMEREPGHAAGRLCMVNDPTPGISDEAIVRYLAFMEEAMANGAFTTFWDVSGKAFPSMGQFRRVIRWFDTGSHSADWDRLVRGHAIVVTQPLLRRAIALMSKLANPPQPVAIVRSRAEAIAFLSDLERPAFEVEDEEEPMQQDAGAELRHA